MNAPALVMPTAPAAPVTLEDVLIHSSKLTEELGSLLRAATRIESALTGYPPAPSGDNSSAPKPAGLILGLHENLCELSQKVSAVSSVLGGIEDRLAAPKVAAAVWPAEGEVRMPYPVLTPCGGYKR